MAKKKKAVKKKNLGKTTTGKLISPKFTLAWKNLIFFVILSLFFIGMYSSSTEELYKNLFSLLSIIFGFVAIALLIVFLVFLFMKIMKKK